VLHWFPASASFILKVEDMLCLDYSAQYIFSGGPVPPWFIHHFTLAKANKLQDATISL
jgi:hypothetical protein